MVSTSTILSCSSLPGSLPWCDRSWWPSVTPGIGGAVGRAGQHDRDEPGRIGLQRQMREVEQQPRSADQVGRIGNILGRLDIDLGLGRLEPAFVLDQPLLQFADAGEVLVELVAIVGAEVGPQAGGLIADVVEDAPAVFETTHLGLHFVGADLRGTIGRTPATASYPPARSPRFGSTTDPVLRPTRSGWGSGSGRRCARPRTGRARSRCESRSGPHPERRSGSWRRPGGRTPSSFPHATSRR